MQCAGAPLRVCGLTLTVFLPEKRGFWARGGRCRVAFVSFPASPEELTTLLSGATDATTAAF